MDKSVIKKLAEKICNTAFFYEMDGHVCQDIEIGDLSFSVIGQVAWNESRSEGDFWTPPYTEFEYIGNDLVVRFSDLNIEDADETEFTEEDYNFLDDFLRRNISL
jgi:hypothetical protein